MRFRTLRPTEGLIAQAAAPAAVAQEAAHAVAHDSR